MLNDQQHTLLEQQNTLKCQTDTLEEQNDKILEQQKLLEKQQQDINKANQGLMEAKGISQEQAQQLVGCVKLVQQAEKRISETNQFLKLTIEEELQDSVERCLGRLNMVSPFQMSASVISNGKSLEIFNLCHSKPKRS